MAVPPLCCSCCRPSYRVPPLQPPQSLTPRVEQLPPLPHPPNLNLDGAFCLPLRSNKPVTSRSAIYQPPTGYTATARDPTELADDIDSARERLPAPTTSRANRRFSLPQERRKSSFTNPTTAMISGRKPRSTWQSVAAKVVVANRLRQRMGKVVKIQDFRIEELGGRSGPLIFGPVAIFNGNVSLRAKKPLKGVTLSVTFAGATEVDKKLVPFLSVTRDVYQGDLDEGLQTFLFGFNFPHVNLPPSSHNPLVSYAFAAKLCIDETSRSASETSSNAASLSEITEYKSKPLTISFIPYVDPILETPFFSRKPSMRRKKSKEKAKQTHSPVAQTINLSSTPSLDTAAPKPISKIEKPKLTLTTADLPDFASGNSTPIIDRPNPATLSSEIMRSTRITDDDGSTIARLLVELPKSRFLPGEEINFRLTLQVKEGAQCPKGFGARVVEARSLALGSPQKHSAEDVDEEERREDHSKMTTIRKEQYRVLAGRKYVLRPEEAMPINRNSHKPQNGGSGSESATPEDLLNGTELVLAIKLRLPSFQTFISDSLLPTSTLPLGDPQIDSNDSPVSRASENIAPGTTPKVLVNGKGKSPVTNAQSSSLTTGSNASTPFKTSELCFVVSHMLQITVPGVSAPWLRRTSMATLAPSNSDLEVAVPLILGNKNPSTASKYKTPEVHLNAPGSYFSSVEGSSRGSRTPSRSSNGHDSNWREGERFLTLRETSARPDFVYD